uniref:PX domain-containing protein n=1 Tax=Hyaloperonospora arabidopsidis (strain Emoy2) TaxID=559515 RepID=M4BEX4_HYAAE
MTSDKRPMSSNKRARSRRKQRAVLRAATRVSASPPTPEGDKNSNNNNLNCENNNPKSEKPESQEPLLLVNKPNSSSDKTTTDDGLDKGLVFVCRPTLPDFCSLFVPRDDAQSVTRVGAASKAVTCKTFTVRVPSFRETREGFVTYALELATCDLPQQTFQLERRFSEFVACAAELTKQQLHITSEEEEKKGGEGETLEGRFQWRLPAKTWFRVTNLKVLEDRRVQLEQALEMLLRQRDGRMCNLPLVRDFLMLDIFGVQVAEQKTLETAAQVEG